MAKWYVIWWPLLWLVDPLSSTADAEPLIRSHRGLVVTRGASTYLQPDDVTFGRPTTKDGALCRLLVEAGDPASFRVGHVTPQVGDL